MTIDFPVVEVREGKARFFIPDPKLFGEAGRLPPSRAPVFYNPRMSLNRDLAVLFLKAYQIKAGRALKVCEPMAGCGVRGLRFALEVDGLERIILNDLNPRAYELAKLNVRHNGLEDLISVENEDAHRLLCRYASPGRRLDYVDVDPFGSPSPFLDSALRALRSGGVLALTATDTAPLSGLHAKACVRKYLGKPLRVSYWREVAVRLLVGATLFSALRHDLAVKPLFSYGVDHYVRVYGILRGGARGADEAVSNLGYVLHCPECLWRTAVRGVAVPLPAECPECGGRLLTGGPLWVGRLWDEAFCRAMLSEAENMGLPSRMVRLIRMVLEECGGPPTYYDVDRVCRLAGAPSLPIDLVVQRLRSMGYWASRTHFHPKGVRTDAPLSALKEAVVA